MGLVDSQTGIHFDDDYTFSVNWKKWFAWYPIRLKGKVIWLKPVYRYRHYIRIGAPGEPFRAVWHYGDIFDVLRS